MSVYVVIAPLHCRSAMRSSCSERFGLLREVASSSFNAFAHGWGPQRLSDWTMRIRLHTADVIQHLLGGRQHPTQPTALASASFASAKTTAMHGWRPGAAAPLF